MGLSLTGAGRGVLGGSTVLYVLGLVLGYGLLVAVGGGGLVALALGVALVARPPRVTIERRLQPDRIVVGGRAQALVVVVNRARTPCPRFVAVDRIGHERVEVPVPVIAPRATARLPYTVPGTRRARLRLGPVVVTRIDPLGLVRRRQPHAADRSLWVHPRTHAAAPVPTGIDVELEGTQVDSAPRGAVTFSSLREYVPGDDVRRIHWRSTARTGTLMVRDQVDTSQPRTTVALDARAGSWSPAAFEAGVEVVASLALAAERAGHPAVLVAPDDPVVEGGTGRAGNGPAGTETAGDDRPSSVLDRLALVEPVAEGGTEVLDRLEAVAPGGAAVFVTGTTDAPTLARVAGLRRRFSLVVMVRVVPEAAARCERRGGLLVLTAGSAEAAVTLWNWMVGR